MTGPPARLHRMLPIGDTGDHHDAAGRGGQRGRLGDCDGLGDLPRGVTCRSRARVERFFHSCEEASLFGVAGDLHALELTAEPDIDVQVTSILMEVKERPVCPREVAAPALLQLRELA